MKALLSSRPALWFLFLFNAVVAAAAPSSSTARRAS